MPKSSPLITMSMPAAQFRAFIREAVEEVLAPSLRKAQSPVMTVSEAAKTLGVSRQRLYEKINAGSLEVIKLPGWPMRVRVPPELLGAEKRG